MADVFGTDFGDLITPGGVSFGVNGIPGAGDDTIRGFGGDDTIEGGAGADEAFGGEGNDSFVFQVGFSGGDLVDGDNGTDTFDFTQIGAGFDGVYSIDLVNGYTQFVSNIEVVIIEVENVLNSDSSASVFGSSANNVLSGRGGDDLLDGRGGRDTLFGDDDNDTLLGGGGADFLYGQNGDDTLNGGARKDVLRGGLDDDRFDYNLVSDSPFSANGANCDELRAGGGGAAFDGPGNAVGDLIDVDGIDAKDNFGEQDFTFGLPGGGGSTEGRLWCVNGANNTTLVRANVDNNPDVDFQIMIFDGAGVLANAYKAVDFDL